MCRLYNRDGDPSYVRLCYKTRHTGERVPWSEAQNYVEDHYSQFGGCVAIAALQRDRKKSGLSEDGRTLQFHIPSNDDCAEILREILRWQLQGTRISVSGQLLKLERDEPWLDLREVLARAASFGWRPHA